MCSDISNMLKIRTLKTGSGAILKFCTGCLEMPEVEQKNGPEVELNMTLLTVQTVAREEAITNSAFKAFKIVLGTQKRIIF